MTTTEEVAQGLRHLMADQLGQADGIQLDGLRRISEGLSRENWVVEGSWRHDGQETRLPLILRRDPEGSLLDTDRLAEFRLLQSLGQAPIPTPRALWLDGDGTYLGRPSLVMVREEGECEWFVLNGDRSLEERLRIAGSLVDLLGDIHRVDWRRLGIGELLPDPGPSAALLEVDRWERRLHEVQLEPHPELALAVAWLRERAPRSQTTVLVHGDYKPGNALLVGEEISAMLDWELAHLGDPLEDLGWITNPYRRREHQIREHWQRPHIVDRYTARTGFAVEETTLYWWNVFSCLKLAAIIHSGVSAFVQGHFDVIYQAPTALYRVMFDLMASAEEAACAPA